MQIYSDNTLFTTKYRELEGVQDLKRVETRPYEYHDENVTAISLSIG